MKIVLLNTKGGLIPYGDESYEAKMTLQLGQIYEAEIKKIRNYQFLKKYWSLIKNAWEMQSEKVRAFFHENIEEFRKTIQIAAGFAKPVYNLSKKEWQEEAVSIRFDSMDELEFHDLYEKVKGVIIEQFCYGKNQQEKINYINNF